MNHLNTKFLPIDNNKLRFYAITPSLEHLYTLCQLGVKTIQLRVKDTPLNEVKELARKAQEICTAHGCQFFLNDYAGIALELNLYGVHLGYEDSQTAPVQSLQKAGIRLGLSTHCPEELQHALAFNPSYIALGPIYKTTLKSMRFEPQGFEPIAQWKKIIPKHIPLVAIGGITLERADGVFDAGADSIAVVSDVVVGQDISHQRVEHWLQK